MAKDSLVYYDMDSGDINDTPINLSNISPNDNSSTIYAVVDTMYDLLASWNMDYIYPKIKECGINEENLQLLTENELNVMFPSFQEIGVKLKFRIHLLEWRQLNNLPIAAPTLSYMSSPSANMMACSNEIHIPTCKSTEPSYKGNSNVSSDIPTCKSTELSYEGNSTVSNIQEINAFFDMQQTKDVLKILNNEPTNATRELICSKIISYIIDKKCSLHASDFELITDYIIKSATNECRAIYYINGARPKGKLYHKYRNTSFNLRKMGLLEPKYKKSKVSQDNKAIPDIIDDASDIECEDNQKWLKTGREPLEVVENKWRLTSKFRTINLRKNSSAHITEFLIMWPILRESLGPRLIEIDFEVKYPEKGSLLKESWTDKHCQFLITKLKLIIKDKHSLEILKNLDGISITPANRNLVRIKLMLALHAALSPTARVKHLAKNNYWKPSISDSQESFIYCTSESSDIKGIIENKKMKYIEYGLSIQPIIFATGSDEKFADFFLYYDEIYYSFKDILSAIDTAFKLIYVCNLKYPFESQKFYEFLQMGYYKISAKSEVSTDVTILVKALNL